MVTKYNIGDKVVVKGTISHIQADADGVKYVIKVLDGEAGTSNQVWITENLLSAMNEGTDCPCK